MQSNRFFTKQPNSGGYKRKIFLTALLILAISLLTVSAQNTASKQINLSLTNATLKEMFNAIEKASNFRFLYDANDVNVNARVTAIYTNTSIDRILREKLTDYTYEIKGNQIVVRSKQTAGGTSAQTPSKRITGVVTDAAGDPLPGVSVLIKGTTQGTATDANGAYSLTVQDENASLEFSYMGFVNQEIFVGNKLTINVMLLEAMQQIEEVVVVGYGTQKKVNLSGAVETVSSKAMENRATRNAALALQGLVPNLYVTPGSGQADDSPGFNIRGTTSINGGSPLILVDGIPTSTSDFARMNTADIDNISVLKDASSAAIYGARAAFGVILVSTKRGQGNISVQFNNSYSMRKLTRVPKPVLDPYIIASYREIMGAPWYNFYTNEDLEYAKRRSEDRSLPSTIINSLNPTQYLYLDNTDWFAEVYDNMASEETHSLSISGDSEKVSYYLGAEFFQERGMLKLNKDISDRFNVRNRVEYRPTQWLTVGNNTALTYFKYTKPTVYHNGYFEQMVKDGDAHPMYPVKNPDGSYTEKGAKMVASLLEGGNSILKSPVISSQFTADFEIIKSVLNIKTDFSAKLTNAKTNAWMSPGNLAYKNGPDEAYRYVVGMINPYITWTNNANSTTENTIYNLFNLYADFRKDFGKHSLSAVGGFSQESERYEYFYGRRMDMITESYPTTQLSTGEMTVTENIYSWAIRSAFYRLTYIFDQKYILETNGRYDGTSRFPKSDRFGFFPSVSAAWIISRESFFEPVTSWMNHAKIRGSYGSLGNQAVGAYPYISTMSAGTVNVLVDEARPMGIYTPGIVSAALTWEKVYTLNGGLDINFLNNRLCITADVYERQTKGMLTKGKTLPVVLGTDEPNINAADLKTKGWELSILWREKFNLAQKPFDYSVRFVLSDYRAYITKFDNPTKRLSDYYEGQEIGEIWGLETLGFFKDQADIDSHADQTAVTSYLETRPIEAGDLKFKDLNNDGVIDYGERTVDNPGDRKVIGNSQSRFPYGLDMNANWNGFNLRIFLQGVGKRDWWPENDTWGNSSSKFFGIYRAAGDQVYKTHLDHWTPENLDAYWPRLKSYAAWVDDAELRAPQTRYLQNAAYLRLKNVTFGYSLPKNLMSRIKIENIQLYFSGENLLEFTKLHENYDPEGLNQNTHPFYRTYSFGLNINF